MTKIKMASVAMDCHPRDKQVNIDKAIGYIEDAAAQGVNLIVFPEETITGFGTCGVREYSAEDKEYMHRACELVPEGNTTRCLSIRQKSTTCISCSELPRRSRIGPKCPTTRRFWSAPKGSLENIASIICPSTSASIIIPERAISRCLIRKSAKSA